MRRSHRKWVDVVLTISKLKRWSINYYIDTARAAETASRDVARAGGGLGEYYSEHETRTPTWLLAGDTHTVADDTRTRGPSSRTNRQMAPGPRAPPRARLHEHVDHVGTPNAAHPPGARCGG